MPASGSVAGRLTCTYLERSCTKLHEIDCQICKNVQLEIKSHTRGSAHAVPAFLAARMALYTSCIVDIVVVIIVISDHHHHHFHDCLACTRVCVTVMQNLTKRIVSRMFKELATTEQNSRHFIKVTEL